MPAHRKTASLHQIEGTYRGDRHGKGRGKVPIDPTPRAKLRPEFVEAWHEVIEAGRDYLAQSDRIAVELAAVLMTQTRGGEGTAAQAAQLANLLQKLGCTPTGRRGLDPVTPPEEEEENPFFKFRPNA